MENVKTGMSRNARATLVVLGSMLILICTGGSIYGASSMSVAPMAERFGVDVATTGLYSTFWTIGLIVGSLVGGEILARFNLRGSCILGGILGALGLALMGMAPNLWIYYLGAFFTGFPIALTGPALLQTAISTWFYSARATVIGVVGMTEALGTTLISTNVARMINNGAGITKGLFVAAAVCLIGNLIAGLFFLKGTPENYGYVPVGLEKEPVAESGPAEAKGLTRKEAMRLPWLWLILAGHFLLNLGYSMLYPQISPYTQFIGFSAAEAALFVSTWSWGKSLSKIVYGFFADKFSLRGSLCIFTIIGIIGAYLFSFAGTKGMLFFCCACFGIIGGITGAGTLTVSRLVGPKDFKKMALLPHAANSFGYMIGPLLFKAIYNGEKSGFTTAFLIGATVIIGYVICIWIGAKKSHLQEP